MDATANYRLVGGFVVLVSVLLIVSLLWLTNLGESRNSEFYTVYFRNFSLSGLQKDSYVTMKGITVGSVVDYQINPDNIEEVQVFLRLEAGTPVKQSTSAIITRNLLTGLAAVELTGGTAGDAALEVAPPNEPYPVIPEGSSPLDEITDSIPDLLENASSLALRAQSLLSDGNVQKVESILQQLEIFSKAANQRMTQIDELLTHVTRLSKSLQETSEHFAALAKDSSSEVKTFITELQNVLEQAQSTFAELELQTNAVASSFVDTSQVFSQQVITVGQSLSEAADSVAQTAESFENPRAIISGPSERALGPGEELSQ